MKHTLKYFFSICLVFSLSLAQAQETTTLKNVADSTRTAPVIPDNGNLKTVKLPEEVQDTLVV